MAFDVREDQGALFPTTKKQKDSNHPDMRSYFMLNGERIQLAGWKKKSLTNPTSRYKSTPKSTTWRAAAPAARHR